MVTAVILKANTKVLTEEQQELICDAMSIGKRGEDIAKSLGFSFITFQRLVEKYPEFDKKMRKAREYWVHSMVETLIGITKGCETMAEVSAAKVESENIKWAAGKYIPSIYSDRISVDVTHHLDLSDILLAADNRVIPILQAKQSLLPGSMDVQGSPILDVDLVEPMESVNPGNLDDLMREFE